MGLKSPFFGSKPLEFRAKSVNALRIHKYNTLTLNKLSLNSGKYLNMNALERWERVGECGKKGVKSGEFRG